MWLANRGALCTRVLSSCSLESAVFSLAGFALSQHTGMWKVCFVAGGLAAFRNPPKHQRSISPDGGVLGVQRGVCFGHSARLGRRCWPVTHTEPHVPLGNVTIHQALGPGVRPVTWTFCEKVHTMPWNWSKLFSSQGRDFY